MTDVSEQLLHDLQEDIRNLRNALFGSVTLQAHYADLLNQYDGGERLTFKSTAEWMARLMELPGGSLLTENAMRAVKSEGTALERAVVLQGDRLEKLTGQVISLRKALQEIADSDFASYRIQVRAKSALNPDSAS